LVEAFPGLAWNLWKNDRGSLANPGKVNRMEEQKGLKFKQKNCAFTRSFKKLLENLKSFSG
jgi:hypothetical protein